MTTDYKDRFATPEPTDEPPPPRWHWVAIGMLAGAFLTWLGTLTPEEPAEPPASAVSLPAEQPPQKPEGSKPEAPKAPPTHPPAKPATIAHNPPAAIATEVIAPQEEEEAEGAGAPPKPHFEFYTVLPEQEVVVGQSPRDTRPPANAPALPALHASQVPALPAGASPGAAAKPGSQPQPATAAIPTKPPTTGEPAAAAGAAAKEGNRFMVQMGSFRNLADADRMRAQVALLGVVAEVQQVALNNGDKVFRVRSGVVDNAESGRIQQRLKENSVATMLMRLK
jgi:cell division protein FtsN